MTSTVMIHFATRHNRSQQATMKVRNRELHPASETVTQITRDPYLAMVENGPDLRYDYPPLLEALVQLGFLREHDKGVFTCIRDPHLQRKAFSLGALAMQGLH